MLFLLCQNTARIQPASSSLHSLSSVSTVQSHMNLLVMIIQFGFSPYVICMCGNLPVLISVTFTSCMLALRTCGTLLYIELSRAVYRDNCHKVIFYLVSYSSNITLKTHGSIMSHCRTVSRHDKYHQLPTVYFYLHEMSQFQRRNQPITQLADLHGYKFIINDTISSKVRLSLIHI